MKVLGFIFIIQLQQAAIKIGDSHFLVLCKDNDPCCI